jgi:hypothetical protein
MSVHDIDLDALSSCCIGFTYLLAQASEVGGQYGWNESNLHRSYFLSHNVLAAALLYSFDYLRRIHNTPLNRASY